LSPIVLHALPISSSLTRSFKLYLAKSTSYEAPHYIWPRVGPNRKPFPAVSLSRVHICCCRN
jgi:hypothetical protein